MTEELKSLFIKAAVKTIKDLIYWQYVKLIAKSAGQSKNYCFIMDSFKKLRSERSNVLAPYESISRNRKSSGNAYIAAALGIYRLTI